MATAAGLGLRVAVLTGPATAEQLADHADLVLQGIHELPLHIRGPGSPA
jgi:phosphoglycolate phosphatase-like HAD superfamily hydrolase